MLDEFPPGHQEEKPNDGADKPLDERLASKAWATRNDAFKELVGLFEKSGPKCSDELFRE